MKNSYKIIENVFNNEETIKENLIKSEFLNPEIEKEFNSILINFNLEKNINFLIHVLIITNYILNFCQTFNDQLYKIVNILNLVALSIDILLIILIFIFKKIKYTKKIKIIKYILFFLVCYSSILIKCFSFNNIINKNLNIENNIKNNINTIETICFKYEEIFEKIFFFFVLSNNLSFYFLKESSNIFLLLILFLNFSLIFLRELFFSNLNYFIYEILYSIFISYFVFLFKKNFDLEMRKLFLKNYQNSKYLTYYRELCNNSNLYQITFKDNKTIFLNKKLKYLLKTLNLRFNETKEKFFNSSTFLTEIDHEDILGNLEELLLNLYPLTLEKKFFNSNVNEYNLLQISKYIINENNNSDINAIDSSHQFSYLGQFIKYDKSNEKNNENIQEIFLNNENNNNNSSYNRRYFTISFRKWSENKIFDLFINEITDLKISESTTEEQGFKQKNLAKIAHEFKTPINSIIGLINNLKENPEIINLTNISSDLNIILNLSNYTIFLINDVIQYVSQSEVNLLKINVEEINLKEIMEFCFNILKAFFLTLIFFF